MDSFTSWALILVEVPRYTSVFVLLQQNLYIGQVLYIVELYCSVLKTGRSKVKAQVDLTSGDTLLTEADTHVQFMYGRGTRQHLVLLWGHPHWSMIRPSHRKPKVQLLRPTCCSSCRQLTTCYQLEQEVSKITLLCQDEQSQEKAATICCCVSLPDLRPLSAL